ncbi:Orf y, partial [Tanacetum coccineum]
MLAKDLTNAHKIIDQLKIKQIRLEEQKDEEIRKLKIQLQKEKEKETEARYSSKEFPPLGNSHIARPFMEAEVHYFGNTTTALKIRKITNQLYNVKVEFEIPSCPMFGTIAIIDTRASTCCINKKVIPEDALEPLTQPIPLIYAFDMNDNNGIEMLIGANFLRSMKGGIRIEGDEITIYKKVTRIKTSNQTEVTKVAITELEVSEEEFMEINKSIYFNQEGSKAFLEQFKPVIERLKHQDYIGEEPLKHWKKNGELCKLDIINLDITIEDRPLKHVTPAMEDSFKKHVDSLLKIGAIRPSKSRHRTMAMIVNSGTTIDPATEREIKGIEKMVFNYKSLNDNTYKDQYSLPGINTIIKRVGGAKIFSKFNLKSGFHQVAMDEESIPWIVFVVLGGLYEWLLMPFGLQNAPVVFQRKMDKCFKERVICRRIVKWKKSKGDPRSSEKICAYASGKFSTTQSTIDAEINACINTLEKLKIYYLDKQEVTLRTDCQAIISFYNKTNSNKSSKVRWIKFADAVTGTCIKINIKHIEGKHITHANSLSRLVNVCFAECTREMKQLAAAALYSVEEVLQSPNAFQKNMKITCEEVMKISNHFQESSHMKNQEHYTDITSSRPTKLQSEWINLMHGDQSPKTLNSQQQKKQSKSCEVYKQSYNAKHKFASACQLKTTTGVTKEKTSEFKTKKPEESSLNWRPLHNDWAVTTSKPKEVQAYTQEDNTYRYNRKRFLEDDDSSDDSIFIVDPGWDDYCLQELKLNRPVPCCLDARRARIICHMPKAHSLVFKPIKGTCKIIEKPTTTTTTTTIELIVIDDLLSALIGIEGRYITINEESAKRIFPLCKSYLLISQFVESRSQFKCGLVNHAFVAALRALLLSHQAMVAQLEHQFRLGRLSIQGLWFYCQVENIATIIWATDHILTGSYLETQELEKLLYSVVGPMMGWMQALSIVIKKASAQNFVGSAVLNLLQSQAK